MCFPTKKHKNYQMEQLNLILSIKLHVMTSSNPNFDEKCNKIGRNPKNCGVTGLERLKCLFYTISRHKAEGKLSFENFFKSSGGYYGVTKT